MAIILIEDIVDGALKRFLDSLGEAVDHDDLGRLVNYFVVRNGAYSEVKEISEGLVHAFESFEPSLNEGLITSLSIHEKEIINGKPEVSVKYNFNDSRNVFIFRKRPSYDANTFNREVLDFFNKTWKRRFINYFKKERNKIYVFDRTNYNIIYVGETPLRRDIFVLEDPCNISKRSFQEEKGFYDINVDQCRGY